MFEGNAAYAVDGSHTPFLEATGLSAAYCAADPAAGDGSRVVCAVSESSPALRHWRIDRDAQSIATLVLDRVDSSDNALSLEVLKELDRALDARSGNPAAAGSYCARASRVFSRSAPTSASFRVWRMNPCRAGPHRTHTLYLPAFGRYAFSKRRGAQTAIVSAGLWSWPCAADTGSRWIAATCGSGCRK